MLSTWPDWLRVVNLILSTVALTHLIRYRRSWGWSELSVANRDQWWIWTIVSAAIVGLATDGILRHVLVTYRSLITTLIVGTLIYGIFVQHLWPMKKDSDENVS